MTELSNTELHILVSPHGAELSSIICGGREYLWQADPIYWKRHSPVLFPIVGSVWSNEYRHEGQTYTLTQHGFARDRDFTLVSQTDDTVWYRLEADAETLKLYPFRFVLEIGYRLEGRKIHVMWRVVNSDTNTLHFQIGAHPAFNLPDFDPLATTHGYFSFDRSDRLETTLIAERGCVDTDTHYPVGLTDDFLPIDHRTFAHDAIILEHDQVHRVTLCDATHRPCLTLHFSAPAVGLWSPPAKNAPFVCIEPWYGRCDRIHYDGELKDKDWMQHLIAGGIFEASYVIEIES